MKVCHTINCLRNEMEFLKFEEFIQRKMFTGVEIFYPYNVGLLQKEFYTEKLKKLKEYDIEFVMHLPHGPKNSLLDNTLSKNIEAFNLLKEAIDYAKDFNVSKLTLHLGSTYNIEDNSLLIEKVIPVLVELCEYANKYNMVVMIENMPGKSELGSTVLELKEIFNRTKQYVSNIKFILDTGHAYVSGKNVVEYIYEFKDLLYHIHFNDNQGLRDEHARMGLGTIDFDEVFKALKDIKYDNLHCLEIIFKTCEELEMYYHDIKKYD